MNGRTPAIPAYIAPEEKNAPVGYTRQIPVVFATNDNYAPYTGVAIASILHNASPENYYRIYISCIPDLPAERFNDWREWDRTTPPCAA